MKNKNEINDVSKLIVQKFGTDVLINEQQEAIQVIPTGSLGLDEALEIKGFPKNRIVEIYGNESSGKTTIALQTVAECQKQGGLVAYFDVECALDINYLKSLNIDISKLLIIQPTTGEMVFEIIETLLKSKNIDLIVVDSVAAMLPLQEKNQDMEDASVGMHARLMSKGLRKIQPLLSNSNTCLIFINQLREKIGVFYGNPETTTGGKALKFYSSIRCEVKKQEMIKSNNDKIGIRSKVTVIKNKLGTPLKTTFVDIYFGKGYDYQLEIIEMAVQSEIITKKGAWFYYHDQMLCQGMNALKQKLLENPTLFDEIKERVLNLSQTSLAPETIVQ